MVNSTIDRSQRVIRWTLRPEKYLGPNKDRFPYEVGINTWVESDLMEELVAYAESVFERDSYEHYKGHQWFFATEEQVRTFIEHRPMRQHLPQCIASYSTMEEFAPVRSVAVDGEEVLKRIPPGEDEFVREWIENWIVNNCKGRVRSSMSPHDNPSERVHWSKTYFVFEDADDAALFAKHWT